MKRLFLTADVHGSLSTWLTIRALAEPHDSLVIAGDLYDTRYGSFSHPDFRPESIKEDIKALGPDLFYVYGNCDEPSFCPGHDHFLEFTALARKIFLHHGHLRPVIPPDADIVVQGHTHAWDLTRKEGKIFINPGSMACPRKGGPTYAIMDANKICIKELKTGQILAGLDLPQDS